MSMMTIKELREANRMMREVIRMTPAQRELLAKAMLAKRKQQETP